MSRKPRSDWYSDTDPRALEVFIECQRRMSPSEKINAMLDLSQMALDTAKAEIRRQYPDATDREVFLRAAARHLDRETMLRAYHWAPE